MRQPKIDNEIRKTIHKQNEKLNKEIKIISENPENLELNNTINKMKNAIEHHHQI